MDYILRAKNLSKTYGVGEGKVEAVKGIDLEIEKGYFYTIIGKSGSGKSTLLHLLSGFDKPTEGKVIFQNKNIHKLKDREISKIRQEKFGFVFQAYNLLPEFCVEENIKMPAYISNSKIDRKYMTALMRLLEIDHLRIKFPNQLSGGEQQRAAIARALIMRPDIIFADEPTGNLDQKSGEKVIQILQYMKYELGQTILLVTHDRDIAKQADRIIRIQDGRIIT